MSGSLYLRLYEDDERVTSTTINVVGNEFIVRQTDLETYQEEDPMGSDTIGQIFLRDRGSIRKNSC